MLTFGTSSGKVRLMDGIGMIRKGDLLGSDLWPPVTASPAPPPPAPVPTWCMEDCWKEEDEDEEEGGWVGWADSTMVAGRMVAVGAMT